MKMTPIEKRFVNRKKKAERNIRKLEADLKLIDLKEIKTVAELGCGVGFVASYLAETHAMTVYGTDYDPGQIQRARELQPKLAHLHFQVEDASKLSFADSSIDLVLSQNVFHHVPAWEEAIKEIARVLRPGGYFLWLDLTFPKWMKNFFLPFVKNYGLYTGDDVAAAFEVHGLKTLAHESSVHGPFRQHHFVLQRH